MLRRQVHVRMPIVISEGRNIREQPPLCVESVVFLFSGLFFFFFFFYDSLCCSDALSPIGQIFTLSTTFPVFIIILHVRKL